MSLLMLVQMVVNGVLVPPPLTSWGGGISFKTTKMLWLGQTVAVLWGELIRGEDMGNDWKSCWNQKYLGIVLRAFGKILQDVQRRFPFTHLFYPSSHQCFSFSCPAKQLPKLSSSDIPTKAFIWFGTYIKTVVKNSMLTNVFVSTKKVTAGRRLCQIRNTFSVSY